MMIVRGLIAGGVVVVVTELAKRSPRWGALVLSLPVVSVIAFIASWVRYRDAGVVSRLARETLVLVPLGLVFFVPLIFSERLGFWPAFGGGVVFAMVVISLWFWLGPASV